MSIGEAAFVVIGVAAIVAFLVSMTATSRKIPEVHVHMEPQESTGDSGCVVLFVFILCILLALAAIRP